MTSTRTTTTSLLFQCWLGCHSQLMWQKGCVLMWSTTIARLCTCSFSFLLCRKMVLLWFGVGQVSIFLFWENTNKCALWPLQLHQHASLCETNGQQWSELLSNGRCSYRRVVWHQCLACLTGKLPAGKLRPAANKSQLSTSMGREDLNFKDASSQNYCKQNGLAGTCGWFSWCLPSCEYGLRNS